MRTMLMALAATVLSACTPRPYLETAARVDLDRYMGQWHSLESLPTSFERGCSCTRAVYAKRPDGRISVVNTCLRDGKASTAEGVARPRELGASSRLEVSFFWPFWGEYSILHVEPDYSYALVGTSNRKMLWILGREARGDPEVLGRLKDIAASKGFDISRLCQVEQGDCQSR